MLQSLKVSEAGMIGQQEKLEIIANNLANANTPGFKRMLTALQAVQPPARGPIPIDPATGQVAPNWQPPGSLLEMTTALDLRAGSPEATGNPLDVAIQGEGFFVVQGPGGEERFTRNGSFSLDAEGRLTTREGYPVLGDGGPLELGAGGAIEIATDGTVRAGGSEVGKLKLVRPADRFSLSPEGSSLLRTADRAQPPSPMPAEEVRVLAGFLEQSNANPISELVSMITAQRIFEAGQRVISTNDETLHKSVNQLPDVK